MWPSISWAWKPRVLSCKSLTRFVHSPWHCARALHWPRVHRHSRSTMAAAATSVGGMAVMGMAWRLWLRLARRLLGAVGLGLGRRRARPLFRNASLLLLDVLVGRRSLLLRRQHVLPLGC